METIFTNNTYCKCVECNRFVLVPNKDIKKNKQHCDMCRKILRNANKRKNKRVYAGLRHMTPGLYKGAFKGGIDMSDISGYKFGASNPEMIGGRYL